MGRRRRLKNCTIKLLRYTKWKCGRLERMIINFLRWKHGYKATMEEIREKFAKYDKKKGSELCDAVLRLSERRIVTITTD